MELILSVSRSPGGVSDVEKTKVFSEAGGTIGRAPGSDWVLPDPERVVSSNHALIEYRDECFHITDTSLNGVFHNGALLGKGNSTPLADGDTVVMGDYEVGVALRGETAVTAPAETIEPFSEEDFEESDLLEPEEPGLEAVPEEDIFGEAEPEPQRRKAKQPEASEVPDLIQPVRLPEASEPPDEGGAIPEDWLEDLQPGSREKPHRDAAESTPPEEAEPAAEPEATTEPPEQEPPPGKPEKEETPAQPPAGEPTPAAARRNAPPAQDLGEAARIFLTAAGIPPEELGRVPPKALLKMAGELFRELTGAITDVLMARARIKSEARLELTTIQPVENNPLKFSISLEDALIHLFKPPSDSSYLEPKRAVREAAMDIKAHQLATIAGMQAAIRKIFQGFDPAKLEARFSEDSLLDSIVPAHRKARYWEAFTKHFAELSEEAEEDFQKFFGEAFARAYETQVRRLKSPEQDLDL